MAFDYKTIHDRLNTLKEQGKLKEIQVDALYKIHINSHYITHTNNYFYVGDMVNKYFNKN